MAKSNAVWGIDIGQCALKALKCRAHEKEDRQLIVESFDFIEYDKILSQPEAEPETLVREALDTFLSRNDLSEDAVAMSVAGQSGLARFIKLPPVESKKIPDIVKYEARQQIPFSLEDVVWDYQQLTGGSEEDGFALEPEVGLFAMKRDQVARALKPLEDAGIEVDYIQLTPLAVYNYVCFDRLEDLQSQSYNPEDPPASTVVISLGTDTTDLVVTNGFRVWQRNIPIGGNHFTRALSKELKLTFAKAEHLKRHATEADDPKAVFQAMRPVFSDLLAEIQRSLGYFKSIDKSAKIGDVIALGNAMKLPGLQRYLAQNLEQPVKPIEDYARLSAGSASGSKQFKDNLLTFAPAYGLCIQGLGKAEIATNLLPEEIVRSRLIRAKKPWIVAGAAAVLAGLTFNYFTHVSAWSETQTQEMQSALSEADRVAGMVSTFDSTRSENEANFTQILDMGEALVSNVEGRVRWLELAKALNAVVPRDPRKAAEREETKEDIESREEIHIAAMDQQHFEDVGSEWWDLVESTYWDQKNRSPDEAGGDALAEDTDVAADGTAEEEGASLSGPGWVVQLTGFHYHNADQRDQTAGFVQRTLIKNLEEQTVELPDGPNGEMVEVRLTDLKISRPFIFQDKKITTEIRDPEMEQLGGAAGAPGAMRRPRPTFSEFEGRGPGGEDEEPPEPTQIELRKYEFVVQFAWQPTTRRERLEIVAARAAAEQEAAEQEALEEEGDEFAAELP